MRECPQPISCFECFATDPLTPISLKPIDIVVLKKLSDVVNVVPVIAKSDSLTLEERQAFKERIKEEFSFHNLKMYPYDNDELDDEERAINAQIKVCSIESNWGP